MLRFFTLRRTAILACALLLTGCAATGPNLRIDSAPDVDLSIYRTFGFPAETGTDRGGYSTLVTSYFKDAVTRELTARGYKLSEQNPDLLVNFFANVRERTEVRSDPSFGFGYYGYRYGLYTAWPLYREREVDTVTYRVGTVNIDVVDAQRKQLIWEGVAEGRITEEQMDNPNAAIQAVVTELLNRFPGRPQM